MTTHTYPPARPPAPGELPACGCEAPEWCSPGNALHGCSNCGRGIDPRVCCPGPPTSPHWAAWLAERDRLETLLVSAEVALAEARRQHRIDQRRKDAGNERSIESSIRKQRAAVAAGGVWDNKQLGARHKTADSERVLESEAAVRAIDSSIFELRAECCMCSAEWDRRRESWWSTALSDPVVARASKVADAAQEVHDRGPTAATYQARIETDAARRLTLLLAVEGARLRDSGARALLDAMRDGLRDLEKGA